MKTCPTCSAVYRDETLNFCLDDGARLTPAVSGEQRVAGWVAESEAATVAFGASGSRSSAPQQQNIQFAKTEDGLRIAYSVIGSGPVLVRVLGHFTHLEMEWEWPDLRYLWQRLASHFTVVRYDGRGIGLSEKYDVEFTEESRLLDLDAVLNAVGADKAMLLGISEGGWTSALYALEQPERIERLIMYGAYARGAKGRPDYDAEEDAAMITLIRKGWGRDTPAFRQLFTSHFFRADADAGLLEHFNKLQRVSADPETAARYWASIHDRGDGQEMFARLDVPTLVIHCQDDTAVNAGEGRLLASVVPNAQLVLLPSGTHYFPTDRDIVERVVSAIVIAS